MLKQFYLSRVDAMLCVAVPSGSAVIVALSVTYRISPLCFKLVPHPSENLCSLAFHAQFPSELNTISILKKLLIKNNLGPYTE